MYSVVEINGHQYKVVPGQVIDVEKLSEKSEGSVVQFDKVLFVNSSNPLVGLPFVSGAKVVAKVIRHDRSRKMIVLRRRPGKYYRKNGHRQHYTALFITELHDGKGAVEKVAQDNKNAAKYLKK